MNFLCFISFSNAFGELDRVRLKYYYSSTLTGKFPAPIAKIFEVERQELRRKFKIMTIVRYDPFRDLRTLQEEVNRLFSTNLTQGFGGEGIGRGAWNPSVDIYENKDHIVLEAELPGMNREDFELTVENNVITLRGERQFEKKTARITIIESSARMDRLPGRSRCRRPFLPKPPPLSIATACCV